MAWTLLGSRQTNYPYAVSRIQAKRGKLIPRSEYDKLLKMEVSEITHYIEESAYRAEVDELAGRFEGLDLLEAALSVNEERTYAEVRRMMQGEGGAVVRVFLSRYIVDDLKAVLRGKNAGATRDELLRELLLEDRDTYDLFQPLMADDVRSVEDVMEALERQGTAGQRWARVMRKVPADAPLPRFEDALEKAYYARLLDAVNGFSQKGAAGLRTFVKREIDAQNLENAARWVAAGEKGDFTGYVMPGGLQLTVAEVLSLSECKNLDEFDERLQDYAQYPDLSDALAEARSTGRLTPFSLAIRRDLYGDLDRLAHQHPLSVVPILSYLLRKHDEVRVLRALARGKAAGLSEARLQEVIA